MLWQPLSLIGRMMLDVLKNNKNLPVFYIKFRYN